MNSEGVWSAEQKFSFSIRAPWWKTWWAYFLYIPLGFLVFMAFFRWRTDNLIKQRSHLVSEVEHATRIISTQKEDVEQKNNLLAMQKEEAEKQKSQIEQAHRQLEKKNLEIISSIAYARRIQSAIMPPSHLVRGLLKNSFILHRPKDIVAGDFYWVEQIEDKIFFAACDCTGHGVPGAMVSVVCNNALNRAVNEFGERLPGRILNKTRELLLENFSRSVVEVSDGMDASLAVLDQKNNKLLWAGANNPLWLVRTLEGKTELKEYKADKQPIGRVRNPQPFTTHEINLVEGDCIYLFTDGYADQFGGKNGKKMTKSGFKSFLLSICHLPMEKQHKSLLDFHNQYRGHEEQVDDVCVIGVKV
jgi:serine phosphatase RsbU (regulator of sigma subunit)